MPFTLASSLFLALSLQAAPIPKDEQARYLRGPWEKPETESLFTLKSDDRGRSIISVTERGAMKMTVTARYDSRDQLLSAEAVLKQGEQRCAVVVEVKDGKARVKRERHEAQEFEVPAGVIVTSAPDWSDTFLLCRRHDRSRAGKQEFPALWIHPEQPAQRLTFSIERVGSDTIEHEGRKIELTRQLLHIRNNSTYAAWTDGTGRMVKLMSLPAKAKGGTELLLAGYEKSAVKLRPPD
jgi:hypothetical protein